MAFGPKLRWLSGSFPLGALIAVLLLRAVGLWNLSLLKETLFWFFGVALIFYHQSVVASDFWSRKIASRTITFSVVLGFFLHFFSFSLLAELLVAPIQMLLVLMLSYLAVYKKDSTASAETGAKFLLYVLGLVYIIYGGYMLFTHPSEVFTAQSFQGASTFCGAYGIIPSFCVRVCGF